MRGMTGSRLAGILSTMAVFLLPALGVGTAAAQEVGDIIPLLVPDQSEFPDDPATMDFTVVAVTEHAYWLVQDSTYLGSNPASPDTDAVWQNFITQAEIDSLTAQFEGDDVDVFGTITGLLGPVPDTDSDPRIWIVFADIPDYYQNQSGPSTRVGRMAVVIPADIDGSEGFNNHDIIYINAGNLETNQAAASRLRTWYIPSGLAMLVRHGVRPDEELWISRGLGQVAQYDCYGLTNYVQGGIKLGIRQFIEYFESSAAIELSNWQSGIKPLDFCRNLGQEFLWFMYLRQRTSDEVLYDLAQSDTTGVLAIARAMDPGVPDSLAVLQLVAPIYNDWLITNVVNQLRSDYEGGIYRYDFLEGSDYQFSHASKEASFVEKFETYPFGNWIASTAYGMAAPFMACQYVMFVGDYAGNEAVRFNGQYSDGSGSGPEVNGKWEAWIVQLESGDDDIAQVVPLEITYENLFNGSFDLGGGGTNYLVVTNNNPGGTTSLRYVLSQDLVPGSVLLAMFQNLANPQYMDVFTTLYDDSSSIPEGYDWYGPVMNVTNLNASGEPDSTAGIDMTDFLGTLWYSRFSAWTEGNHEIYVAGYDSAGHYAEQVRTFAVGYVETQGLVMDITEAAIDIPAGAMSPGTYVMLAQTDMLGLAIQSELPIDAVEPAMSGILAGPVSLSDVEGTISFPADDARGSVYRWNGSGWTRLDSYLQAGRMCAPVSEGGIYVFGTAPGVASPELPAVLTLSGNAPNPFSSETVISFSLPTAGMAVLRVYDMTGRVVRTLADGEMAAASHSVVWDGRDETGNVLGTGVYFCRLEAAGQSAVQKMLRVGE